jgi:hypothetical protein
LSFKFRAQEEVNCYFESKKALYDDYLIIIMPIPPRIKVLKKIQKLRNSKVISLFLGTKPNLPTRMGTDAIRYIYDHLEELKKCDNLDLFLYTRGGDTLVPHRLTKILREFGEKFSILVPYTAASAGTLLCLGANELVMTKMGELSPIDPTTANKFNPVNPKNKDKVIPISVEDVTSFLALAEEKGLIRGEENTLEVFKDLTGQRDLAIHPLALGNVYRALRLIRDIAKKQLLLHLDSKENAKIERIVQNLTELIYSHQYLIDREELKSMELNIINAETISGLHENMWNLYKLYEDEVKMLEPFDPLAIIQPHLPQAQQARLPANLNLQLPQGVTAQQAQQIVAQLANRLQPPTIQVPFSNYAAFIESENMTHAFKYSGTIMANILPQGKKEINVEMKGLWERIR